MLQKIRDRIQGWFAGIIIVLVAFAFVFWGLEYYVGHRQESVQVAATVNGETITDKQVDFLYKRMQQRNVPQSPDEDKMLKQMALDNLVDEMLLQQDAIRMGLQMNMNQVERFISTVPEFQENGQFSPTRFNQIVAAEGLSLSQYLHDLQSRILVNQISSGLQLSAMILPSQAEHLYRLFKQKRSFGYLQIEPKQIESSIQVSDAEVENYYQQHKPEFKSPEMVSVNYLLLSPETLHDRIKISDKQIAEYYENNKENYKQPKRWQVKAYAYQLPPSPTPQQLQEAKQIMTQVATNLRQGKSVDQIVHGHENIKFENTWVDVGKLGNQEITALSPLSEKEVTEPFLINNEYRLMQVLKIQPEKYRSLEESESQIRQMLTQQKIEELTSELSDQLSNLTYTNPKTLEVAAKELNLAIQTSPPFSKAGLKSGIFANKNVVKAAFNPDVLNEDYNSEPITLKNNNVIVLRKEKYVPSEFQTFDQVKSNIRKNIIESRARDKTGMIAYQIVQALKDGKDPHQIAKQYQSHWIENKDIIRDNKTINREILAVVFNMAPQQSKTPLAVSSEKLKNGDYVVIALTSIQLPTVTSAAKADIDQFKKEAEQYIGGVEYQLYKRSARDHAKIIIKSNKK